MGERWDVDLALLADGVVTMTGSQLWAGLNTSTTALGIRDGRIVALGERDDVTGWHPRRVLAVPGIALPGFVEPHAHPVSVAYHQPEVSLSGLTRLDDVRQALASQAADVATGGWVFGTDLEPSEEIDPGLGALLIDPAVGSHPAYVRLFDGHSAIVSSAALALCGIDGSRELGEGADVVRDWSGRPTGELREDPAMALAEAYFPVIPDDRIAGRLLNILDDFAACGITTVRALDDRGGAPWRILELAESIRPLPVRVLVSPVCHPGCTEDDWLRLLDLQGRHGDHWEVRGIKLFLDGTIDNGTGWLVGGDTAGACRDSVWAAELAGYRAAIAFFERHTVATATHAIGDAAVAEALDAIIAAGGSPNAHRVEHIEAIAAERVGQFARHGIVASMQPVHSARFIDPAGTDPWSRRLGPERVAAQGYRFGALADSGALLALGSDWPVAAFDPRQTLAAAVLQRQLAAPADTAAALPDQRLSFGQALAGITCNAAIAAGGPEVTGTIALGGPADLVVWPTEAVRQARVAVDRGDDAAAVLSFCEARPLLTMLAGDISYRHSWVA